MLQLAGRAMGNSVVSRILWNCLPAATSRLSWKGVAARLQAGSPGSQADKHGDRPQIAKRRSPRFGHVVLTSKLIVTIRYVTVPSAQTAHDAKLVGELCPVAARPRLFASALYGVGQVLETSCGFASMARDGQRARRTMTEARTMRKPFRHPLGAWTTHRTESKTTERIGQSRAGDGPLSERAVLLLGGRGG